jgi:ABC-type nitrate/sulfonate/bicarbonate transport system substrate-binding protein
MTMPTTRRRFNTMALSTLAATAAGATLVRRAAALDLINFQANWINDPEFLGYMIAIDNGYYAAEGLNVNYMPGGPDLIPEGSLLSGKADIALTSIISTVKGISEKGAPLKIIGTQYQKSPAGVISLVGSGINGPKDLAGKTVACPPLSLGTFQAMLAANNIPAASVRVVPYTFDPTPLVNGSVDAIIDFIVEIPFLAEQKGKKVSYFLFWDFGLPLFIDLLVVTNDTLKSKRSQLVKFLRASRKGWAENDADAKKYPAKYAETWFKGNGSSLDAELFHNTMQIPLMASPKGLFVMDDEAIGRNLEALQKVGVKGTRDMFDGSLLAEI